MQPHKSADWLSWLEAEAAAPTPIVWGRWHHTVPTFSASFDAINPRRTKKEWEELWPVEGGKVILRSAIDGDQSFAEAEAAKAFRRSGWKARWTNAFGVSVKWMKEWGHETERFPQRLSLRLRSIEAEAPQAKPWDVMAWHGDEVMFVECKAPGEGFTDAEQAFIWAATQRVGLAPANFAVLQADIRFPQDDSMNTLPDRPCRPGGTLLVGINPSPVSVEAVHYYQGTLGKRLWGRLARLGLLELGEHVWEDDAFVAAGNGLTDLVKRPTPRASDLSRDELVDGRQALAQKVRDWDPGLLLFAFRPPAEALLGRDVSPGSCADFEDIPTFLLSGPYASAVAMAANDAVLLDALGSRTPARSSRAAMKRRTDMPSRPVSTEGVGGPTQRVTAADLKAGRIRLPARNVSGAKAVFPDRRAEVDLVLRGRRLRVRYDPRDGPDRERSGVLSIGRDLLQSLVAEGEDLQVEVGPDDAPTLT